MSNAVTLRSDQSEPDRVLGSEAAWRPVEIGPRRGWRQRRHHDLKRLGLWALGRSGRTGELLRAGYQWCRWAVLRCHVWRNTRGHRHYLRIDPFRVLWIDPARVERWILGTERRHLTWRKMGAVEAGDWDRRVAPFADLPACQSLDDHFVRGVPWQDTILFASTVRRIAQGEVCWGCSSVAAFEQRLQALDALYTHIRLYGYRTQRELIRLARIDDPMRGHMQFFCERQRALDEVVVSIGRRGELLFVRGGSQHRLSIARILGIRSVPARILVRHAEWQQFRDRVATFVDTSLGGRVSHEIPHPDLAELPSRHRSAHWFSALSPQIIGAGSLLEVGAGISAYFAHRFSESGIACHAVEEDAERATLLREVVAVTRARLRIHSRLPAGPDGTQLFGAVLVLDDFYRGRRYEDVLEDISVAAGLAARELDLFCRMAEPSHVLLGEILVTRPVLANRLARLGFSEGGVVCIHRDDDAAVLRFVRSP